MRSKSQPSPPPVPAQAELITRHEHQADEERVLPRSRLDSLRRQLLCGFAGPRPQSPKRHHTSETLRHHHNPSTSTSQTPEKPANPKPTPNRQSTSAKASPSKAQNQSAISQPSNYQDQLARLPANLVRMIADKNFRQTSDTFNRPDLTSRLSGRHPIDRHKTADELLIVLGADRCLTAPSSRDLSPRHKQESAKIEAHSVLKSPSRVIADSCHDVADTMGHLIEALNKLSLNSTFGPATICDENQWHLEPSWSTVVRTKAVVAGHQEAIWELLVTEANYLRQLRVTRDLFMGTLMHLQRSAGLLNEIDVCSLFGNLDQVFEANSSLWASHLLPMLEASRLNGQPLNPRLLLDAFRRINDLFAPYPTYCLQHGDALRYLRRTARSNELFKVYVAWCESQKDCERLRLTDLLAKPMQRLTRYPLLLRAVLKRSEDQSQVEALREIVGHIERFVLSVNLELRRRDDRRCLDAITKALVGFELPFSQRVSELADASLPQGVTADAVITLDRVYLSSSRSDVFSGQSSINDNNNDQYQNQNLNSASNCNENHYNNTTVDSINNTTGFDLRSSLAQCTLNVCHRQLLFDSRLGWPPELGHSSMSSTQSCVGGSDNLQTKVWFKYWDAACVSAKPLDVSLLIFTDCLIIAVPAADSECPAAGVVGSDGGADELRHCASGGPSPKHSPRLRTSSHSMMPPVMHGSGSKKLGNASQSLAANLSPQRALSLILSRGNSHENLAAGTAPTTTMTTFPARLHGGVRSASASQQSLVRGQTLLGPPSMDHSNSDIFPEGTIEHPDDDAAFGQRYGYSRTALLASNTRIKAIRAPIPLERLAVHELANGSAMLCCLLNDPLTIASTFLLWSPTDNSPTGNNAAKLANVFRLARRRLAEVSVFHRAPLTDVVQRAEQAAHYARSIANSPKAGPTTERSSQRRRRLTSWSSLRLLSRTSTRNVPATVNQGAHLSAPVPHTWSSGAPRGGSTGDESTTETDLGFSAESEATVARRQRMLDLATIEQRQMMLLAHGRRNELESFAVTSNRLAQPMKHSTNQRKSSIIQHPTQTKASTLLSPHRFIAARRRFARSTRLDATSGRQSSAPPDGIQLSSSVASSGTSTRSSTHHLSTENPSSGPSLRGPDEASTTSEINRQRGNARRHLSSLRRQDGVLSVSADQNGVSISRPTARFAWRRAGKAALDSSSQESSARTSAAPASGHADEFMTPDAEMGEYRLSSSLDGRVWSNPFSQATTLDQTGTTLEQLSAEEPAMPSLEDERPHKKVENQPPPVRTAASFELGHLHTNSQVSNAVAVTLTPAMCVQQDISEQHPGSNPHRQWTNKRTPAIYLSIPRLAEDIRRDERPSRSSNHLKVSDKNVAAFTGESNAQRGLFHRLLRRRSNYRSQHTNRKQATTPNTSRRYGKNSAESDRYSLKSRRSAQCRSAEEVRDVPLLNVTNVMPTSNDRSTRRRSSDLACAGLIARGRLSPEASLSVYRVVSSGDSTGGTCESGGDEASEAFDLDDSESSRFASQNRSGNMSTDSALRLLKQRTMSLLFGTKATKSHDSGGLGSASVSRRKRRWRQPLAFSRSDEIVSVPSVTRWRSTDDTSGEIGLVGRAATRRAAATAIAEQATLCDISCINSLLQRRPDSNDSLLGLGAELGLHRQTTYLGFYEKLAAHGQSVIDSSSIAEPMRTLERPSTSQTTPVERSAESPLRSPPGACQTALDQQIPQSSFKMSSRSNQRSVAAAQAFQLTRSMTGELLNSLLRAASLRTSTQSPQPAVQKTTMSAARRKANMCSPNGSRGNGAGS